MDFLGLIAVFLVLGLGLLVLKMYRDQLPTKNKSDPLTETEPLAVKRALPIHELPEHDINKLGIRNLPKDFEVKRVYTTYGSHIEPSLSDAIANPTDLDKLVWRLAVLKADTGLDVQVEPARVWIEGAPIYGEYKLIHSGTPKGNQTFHETWIKIAGIETGWELTADKRINFGAVADYTQTQPQTQDS